MTTRLPLTECFFQWLDVDLALCDSETEQRLFLKGAVHIWNAALITNPQQKHFELVQARMELSFLIQKNYLKKSGDQIIDRLLERRLQLFPQDKRRVKQLTFTTDENNHPNLEIISEDL